MRADRGGARCARSLHFEAGGPGGVVARKTLHLGRGVVQGELKEQAKMNATATTARTNPGQLAFDVGDAVTVSEGYRGPTVCKIVGITYRQLDYWARTGLVEPTVRRAEGSGSQRLYAFEDVLQIKIVKRLLDTGVSLQKVRMAIEELRARGKSVVEATLISDGTSVYTVDSDLQVLDLLRRGQGVFALSLEPVIEELRGEVSAFPAERITDRPTATVIDTELARLAQ